MLVMPLTKTRLDQRGESSIHVVTASDPAHRALMVTVSGSRTRLLFVVLGIMRDYQIAQHFSSTPRSMEEER